MATPWAAKNAPAEEPRAGRGLFVGQDLGIGQPGVVVDGGVDIVVADRWASGSVLVAGAVLVRVAAMNAMAASRRNAAQLLDVHVDQLARVGALIAADRLPGRPVHPGQPVQPVAAQHPVHGGGRQPNQGADPGRAELAHAAQFQDGCFQLSWGSVGMMVRPAGPVDQASRAVLAVAAPSAVGAGAGDAHLSGDVGDGAASGDALAQDPSSDRGEAGVSVGHEDLQQVSRQTAPPRRRSSPHVNNPHAQYS